MEPVPPAALLGEQLRRQLTAMRLESGLQEADFDSAVRAPILASAQWVQRLPASHDGSHREAGGLVRLAVECAAMALRRADGKLFHAPGRGPAGGVRSDTAWRYAAVLAALFSTIGRRVARWRVFSEEGEGPWNPYALGIEEWLAGLGSARYRVALAPPAAGIARAGAGACIAARCLDRAQFERLDHDDGEIVGALVDVLGSYEASTLGQIVREARGAVIAEDVNRARQHPGRLPTPVEQQVLGVMRALMAERWTVNTAGGRVWVAQDAVYLNWNRAAEDIVRRWRADYEDGPDLDAAALAALLLEHGLIVPGPSSGPEPSAQIQVILKPNDADSRVELTCVRLADPRIFALNVEGVWPVSVVPANGGPGRLQPADRPPPDDGPPPAEPPPERDDEHPGPTPAPRQAAARKRRPDPAGEETPPAGEPSAVPPLPELSAYGEVGRVLSDIARAPQPLCSVIGDGVAVPHSAIKGRMPPRAFIEQCRMQGILADDKPRPGHTDGSGPAQPYILLAAHLADSLSGGRPIGEQENNEPGT